jgi:hypothetical protein
MLRPARAGILLVLLAIFPLAWPAEMATRVFPLLPADGAVTGARPLFQIGYEGIDEADLRRARFRIELSEDRFRSRSLLFDQRERSSGWSAGEDGRFNFRPPKPLEDGSYEWRVSLWNGTSWSGGDRAHSLRIDTIPPAPVASLRLEQIDGGKAIRLSWKPVVLDLDGRAEYVSRYHVYRYRGSPPFPLTAAYEIAVTEGMSLEVESDADSFYRVTAEDEAGNETGRRR